ncbi:MAG: DUF4114 domain-containing protein [Amphiplicatus sp.]
MSSRRVVVLCGVLAAAVLFGGRVNAAIINYAANQIISEGGDVYVRFDSVSAGHSSNLVSPDLGAVLFNNKTASIGTVVNLGSFAAGQVIDFRLDNLTTGLSYFTGPSANNVDNSVHALLNENTDGSVTVGFEDLSQGSDWDYNDLVFSVFEVPLPAAAWLLLAGLAGLSFASRRSMA